MRFYSFLLVCALLGACKDVKTNEETRQYQQWHTVTLSFEGPETSETDTENPFLDYRLQVHFKNGETEYTVRGFYAADGNAAESGATSGAIWQVRFTPDKLGKWSYGASLAKGDGIALKDNEPGNAIELSGASGVFEVVPSDKKAPDFREKGRLTVSQGYFQFKETGDYWIKGGANSPENLLAFQDFDATYRMETSREDGEASTNDTIHAYKPHLQDWNNGDTTWRNGKGKGLIGALNYLASKGMNVAYFLTNNIGGDGKDVWPYVSPDDFTRFDVSKLDQWEMVFQHMQSKGIMLHMVLQETENETLLDGGDTGPLRQLYLQEMVARFGHHLAITYNLGEENGPAHFSPIGQTDAQRKAMVNFLTQIDPYNTPMLLHTHAFEPARADVLDSITGFKPLDGLSLQVDKREGAAAVVQEWKLKSREAGHEWMITMDEIGMWHTGAQADTVAGNHDTLRSDVLWGTLLSGAAGVEWYFGANTYYNDLNTEDWRSRDRLWEVTDIALHFFREYLPYWEMVPDHGLLASKKAYCFSKPGELYAIYLPDSKNHKLDLSGTEGDFTVAWYDPLEGGALQKGSVQELAGGQSVELGFPPNREPQDWVVLLEKKP